MTYVALYYSLKSENANPWPLFFLKSMFLLFGIFCVSYIDFKIAPSSSVIYAIGILLGILLNF